MTCAEAVQRRRLSDGTDVLLRPIRSTDGPSMLEAFSRLSDRSRRARFLVGKDKLSTADVQYLTHVDHVDHEAICAFDPSDGSGIGAARYIRSADDRQTAEIALTVIDQWQHRGLGTQLMSQLLDVARRAGVRRVRAYIDVQNAEALGLLRKLGLEHTLAAREANVAEFHVALPAYRQSFDPEGCAPWH